MTGPISEGHLSVLYEQMRRCKYAWSMTRSDFLAITPADLRISDGNWKIAAHIGVLSHYPYFKDSVAMLELAGDKSVRIPDFSEDLVRRVIEFLYSGYLELPVEGSVQDIIAFLDAIHRFEDKYLLDLLNTPVRKRLQEIYRFCAEYAEKELTPLRSLPSHLLKDLVVSPLVDLRQTLPKDRITINGVPYDVNLTVLMARSLFFRENLSKSSSIYIPEVNQQFVEKWIESIYKGNGNSFSGGQKQNSSRWAELIDEKNAFECL